MQYTQAHHLALVLLAVSFLVLLVLYTRRAAPARSKA